MKGLQTNFGLQLKLVRTPQWPVLSQDIMAQPFALVSQIKLGGQFWLIVKVIFFLLSSSLLSTIAKKNSTNKLNKQLKNKNVCVEVTCGNETFENATYSTTQASTTIPAIGTCVTGYYGSISRLCGNNGDGVGVWAVPSSTCQDVFCSSGRGECWIQSNQGWHHSGWGLCGWNIWITNQIVHTIRIERSLADSRWLMFQ